MFVIHTPTVFLKSVLDIMAFVFVDTLHMTAVGIASFVCLLKRLLFQLCSISHLFSCCYCRLQINLKRYERHS
jgi:hypothetical protein